MKIVIGKTSGFCMGVRRAVEMVLDAPDVYTGPIFTYGPLIHNPQVLELLAEKGITTLNEIPLHGSGTVLIRAHGVPPLTKEKLRAAGFDVVDATCPRVIRVQTIIGKHARKNFASIIVGNPDHPEVIGLLGYAARKGYVVASREDLEALPELERAIIVAQTTQNVQFFETVKQWAARHHPHYKIFETICDSTQRRQAEVQRLAESVEAVIVVGGHNSGNTRRLVEISRQTGKPAYHIESETELASLDLATLAAARQIGIIAGASTPNWIIKKVYRTLETLVSKRRHGWHRTFFGIQRALLLTNIYVALGAGCLCYASTNLQGIGYHFPYAIIALLYVQSMHILNHLTGSRADRFNDPERAYFYRRHKVLLTVLAVVAGGLGLITAFALGGVPFLSLLVMSALGLSYNLRLVPKRFAAIRFRKISDIPGSKTLLIAMAWGIVTVLLPPLSVYGRIGWSNLLVFLWAAGMVFARTAFFDILDMQGDRIVGQETIPILLGEKRSMRLLKGMLIAMIAIPPLASSLQLLSRLGFVLAVCPAFVLVLLSAYERGAMLPGTRLEFLVETNFILAGVLSLGWALVH